MRIDAHESIASAHPWLTILFYAGIAACPGAASCSSLPDWSDREARRSSITAHYGPSGSATHIVLPTSTQHLLIEELQITPADLVESFTNGKRQLHLPAGGPGATIRCRYRQFRDQRGDGRATAWQTPDQLFPGARRIERNQ